MKSKKRRSYDFMLEEIEHRHNRDTENEIIVNYVGTTTYDTFIVDNKQLEDIKNALLGNKQTNFIMIDDDIFVNLDNVTTISFN